MSQAQRDKLSASQRAYVQNDPRWEEHRRKLAEAQICRRMTLLPNEVELIQSLRHRGRTFSYIEQEIGVCGEVIGRELKAMGIHTGCVRPGHRAKRGKGFWRSFDE
jgi:hypothetical protein